MGLTKRELAVVAETQQGAYTVWIKPTDNGYWKVEIHLGERPYEIVTTRGTTKCWRLLSDVIEFVQKNAKGFKDCFISVGQWVLTIHGVANNNR
ncbi:hypothetical protein [Xanthomonas albilineans]|uniref:hypothetical protein n=1 Tax=Xanthomonas albilineans TaxID=29447 RepID=UPI0005F34AC9